MVARRSQRLHALARALGPTCVPVIGDVSDPVETALDLHGRHASAGTFTIVSSVGGKRGLPTRTGYAASKFALQGLFESVRSELDESGVHLDMVCPGYTETDLCSVALGPDGKPRGETGVTSGSVMSADSTARHILTAVRTRRRELVLTPGGRLLVSLNKWALGLVDRLANHLAG